MERRIAKPELLGRERRINSRSFIRSASGGQGGRCEAGQSLSLLVGACRFDAQIRTTLAKSIGAHLQNAGARVGKPVRRKALNRALTDSGGPADAAIWGRAAAGVGRTRTWQCFVLTRSSAKRERAARPSRTRGINKEYRISQAIICYIECHLEIVYQGAPWARQRALRCYKMLQNVTFWGAVSNQLPNVP